MENVSHVAKEPSFFSYPAIFAYLSMLKEKQFLRVHLLSLIAFFLIYATTDLAIKEGNDPVMLSLTINWLALIYVFFISIPVFRSQNHYGFFSYKQKSFQISNFSFQIREIGLIWFLGSIVILVPTYRALNPTFFLDFMFFCIIFFYNSAFILLYSLISFKIMSRIINFDQTKENPTFSFSLSNISWYAGSLCVIIPLVIINVLLMGNAFRLLENLNMSRLFKTSLRTSLDISELGSESLSDGMFLITIFIFLSFYLFLSYLIIRKPNDLMKYISKNKSLGQFFHQKNKERKDFFEIFNNRAGFLGKKRLIFQEFKSTMSLLLFFQLLIPLLLFFSPSSPVYYLSRAAKAELTVIFSYTCSILIFYYLKIQLQKAGSLQELSLSSLKELISWFLVITGVFLSVEYLYVLFFLDSFLKLLVSIILICSAVISSIIIVIYFILNKNEMKYSLTVTLHFFLFQATALALLSNYLLFLFPIICFYIVIGYVFWKKIIQSYDNNSKPLKNEESIPLEIQVIQSEKEKKIITEEERLKVDQIKSKALSYNEVLTRWLEDEKSNNNSISMFLHDKPLFSKKLSVKHNLRLHISDYSLSKEKRTKLVKLLQKANLIDLFNLYPERCTENQLLQLFFIFAEVVKPETLYIQELSRYVNVFGSEYIISFLNKREQYNQTSIFSW